MTRLHLPLLLLLLTSSLAQNSSDQDLQNCSYGNLDYLCQNYEICSKYGLISERDRDLLCSPLLDPTGISDILSSTKTPPREQDLTSSQFTTSRVGDEITTSRVGEEITTSRVGPDVSPSTDPRESESMDNKITTAAKSSRETSEYTGTADNGIRTEYASTDNGVNTQIPTSVHSRDFGTISRAHSRVSYSLTMTESALVTSSPSPSTPTQDDSFTTATEELSTAAVTAFTTEVGTGRDDNDGEPPVITVPPRNITVPPGGSGRFDCTAKAATTPQITITKKDQTTVPDLDNFVEATGSGRSQATINSVTINNVDKPNEGWYTCQAANKYGYVRADAFLTVKDLCEDVVCPGDKLCRGNYEEGEGHTCECPTYCEMSELFIQDYVCSNYCEEWFNECQMKMDACNNDKFAIEVMNSGRCGRIEAPEILEESEKYGVQELYTGSELIMECHATGFPEPEIKWYRGTEVVGEGNELYLTVGLDDTGDYMCEAVNCKRSKVSKRLAVVLVSDVPTTPPLPTTPTPTTPMIDPGKFEYPDPPRSTCAVFGDPHFLTYDQRAYSYMGTCDNVLAMDCEMGRWFVYGRMRPCGRSGGSCLETVTAYVDNEILELQRGWLVNRNGGKIVPKNHPNKVIPVYGEYNNFTLLFDGSVLTMSAVLNSYQNPQNPSHMLEEKLVIHWDGYVSAQIQTPRDTLTCGMCGDNDGNPDNDMQMRRSGRTDDPVEFGESWKLDPRGRCQDTEPAQSAQEVCGDKYEATKTECERIWNTEKFRECAEMGHDPAVWIEGCIYDECEGQMQRDDLPPKCVVAAAYAMRCKNDYWERDNHIPNKNEGVRGWEADANCPTPDERFQPTLDTGCPQPTLEEELAGNFK